MTLFLQVLKETGARRGEAFNLKWTDIDLQPEGTITPEKGSNPREFALSPKLLKMLNPTSTKAEPGNTPQ
jgi:integrase